MTEKKSIFTLVFESKALILFFFLMMLFIRLLYLDADPSFVKRIGDLGDEGIWVHNARTLFLFDDPVPDQATQSLSVSPLNTALMIASFHFLGVDTFAARLPSALAGWFTLIIFYFFLRKAWGKKAAFVGTAILGLNEAFLIYNKLAFGISLEAMFLLLSFFLWYKGQEKNIFYFLAGISFAGAILSKLSAYYFAFIFVVLWLLQLYRKETKAPSIIIFGLGGMVLLLPYLFFLFSNWEVLSANFMVLKNYYNSEGVIILNIFRAFANNFFGLPSVFLLLVLTSLYFLSWSQASKEKISEKMKSISGAELIALCWLMLGLVLLIFLSDLSDRRFFSLIIPMSMLSARLFFSEEFISFNAGREEKMSTKKNLLYAFLFSFPIFSLAVSSLSLYFCSPINACKNWQGQLALLWIVILVLFWMVFTFIPGKVRKYCIHFGIIFSLAVLLFVPLSTLLRHFSRHYALITSTMEKEITYLLSSSLLLFILMMTFIFLSFRYQNLLIFTPALIKKVFLIYFVVSGSLIALALAAPTFSFKESSHSLDSLLQDAEVSGFLVGSLSLEASYLPILMYRDGPFKEINYDYDMSRIRYVFKREMVDGKSASDSVDLLSFYRTSRLIKRLYLYPYPFTDKYRMVVAVYEVEGYRGRYRGKDSSDTVTRYPKNDFLYPSFPYLRNGVSTN